MALNTIDFIASPGYCFPCLGAISVHTSLGGNSPGSSFSETAPRTTSVKYSQFTLSISIVWIFDSFFPHHRNMVITRVDCIVVCLMYVVMCSVIFTYPACCQSLYFISMQYCVCTDIVTVCPDVLIYLPFQCIVLSMCGWLFSGYPLVMYALYCDDDTLKACSLSCKLQRKKHKIISACTSLISLFIEVSELCHELGHFA